MPQFRKCGDIAGFGRQIGIGDDVLKAQDLALIVLGHKPGRGVGVAGDAGADLIAGHRRGFRRGAALGDDVTQGLPRVEELLEARSPKGQAFVSEIAGTVKTWEDGTHYVVQVTPKDGHTDSIPLDGRTPSLKSGTDVMAGDIVMQVAKDNGVSILPIDSEHGAIHQCIKEIKDVKNLIITASGGPFRTKTIEEIKAATVEQALAHPKWNMGKKI